MLLPVFVTPFYGPSAAVFMMPPAVTGPLRDTFALLSSNLQKYLRKSIGVSVGKRYPGTECHESPEASLVQVGPLQVGPPYTKTARRQSVTTVLWLMMPLTLRDSHYE